jgi:ligand-binding sensor domain-containing protein
MQDREGNYWFGTNSGISMIRNFDNYAIAQHGVRLKGAQGMTPDLYNRIWIYSRSLLYLFQNDQLTPVDLRGTLLEKTGIYHINIFNSELIISNSLGIYQMPITEAFPDLRKLRKIAEFPSTNTYRVRSLYTDSTGIWIGTERKLYNYYDRQFLSVTFNYPDTVSLRPNKILQDKSGSYWYGDYT